MQLKRIFRPFFIGLSKSTFGAELFAQKNWNWLIQSDFIGFQSRDFCHRLCETLNPHFDAMWRYKFNTILSWLTKLIVIYADAVNKCLFLAVRTKKFFSETWSKVRILIYPLLDEEIIVFCFSLNNIYFICKVLTAVCMRVWNMVKSYQISYK